MGMSILTWRALVGISRFAIFAMMMASAMPAPAAEPAFAKARPVWLEGREREMNLQAGFVCRYEAAAGRKYALNLAGSSLFRVYVNGRFVHYGPARGPHGYVRLDAVDLTPYTTVGANIVAVEVAGYYCSNFYTMRLASFLQAEVFEDGKLIRATGDGDGFAGFPLAMRVQKAMRYAFQRAFTEVYHVDAQSAAWMTAPPAPAKLAVVDPNVGYLPREAPVPDFTVAWATRIVETGEAKKVVHPAGFKYQQDRHINGIGPQIHGYKLEEIAEKPFETLQDYSFTPQQPGDAANGQRMNLQISAGRYALLDMGQNNTGFIKSRIIADEPSEVLLAFDEKLMDGKLNPGSWATVNVVKYTLAAGEYDLESFEVYGYRYIQCFVTRGKISLKQVGLREYACPLTTNTTFSCGDERMNAIFRAAVQTYRQNTLDVFMDCPSRERAGWLCDAYFTAQSAQYFGGSTIVEKVMLEDFVLAREFPVIPRGMLAMCYPADHTDGVYIPQWAMWYVVELDAYFKRSGETDKAKFRKLCYDLIAFLDQKRNADGLLEKLDSWNFVEWSAANNWVQDVNYPTNMLYARVLEIVGRTYGDEALLARAAQMKVKIIQQSFNGKYFVDHAVRQPDGSLKVLADASEVCQYFAFFFNVADPQDPKFANLKELVLNTFGPERKAKQIMPEIAYANAFVGNYLRMEVLLRWRRYGQIVNESVGYFHNMAKTTGTLWENDSISGSLNHGFASFAGVALVRCLLGVQEIDVAAKRITLDFSDVPLAAEGTVGTPWGPVKVRREVLGEKSKPSTVKVTYSAPPGCEVKMQKVSDQVQVVKE